MLCGGRSLGVSEDDSATDILIEHQRRKQAKIWEEGFKAGRRSAVTRLPIEKNPYGVPEKPGPPPFPEFHMRMDENQYDTMSRWTNQMLEFRAAWDEWSAKLR
jgi:hypothetical protein